MMGRKNATKNYEKLQIGFFRVLPKAREPADLAGFGRKTRITGNFS